MPPFISKTMIYNNNFFFNLVRYLQLFISLELICCYVCIDINIFIVKYILVKVVSLFECLSNTCEKH